VRPVPTKEKSAAYATTIGIVSVILKDAAEGHHPEAEDGGVLQDASRGLSHIGDALDCINLWNSAQVGQGRDALVRQTIG